MPKALYIYKVTYIVEAIANSQEEANDIVSGDHLDADEVDFVESQPVPDEPEDKE